MKHLIRNLYTLNGSKAQQRVDELRTQIGLAAEGSTSSEFVEHSLATAANDFVVASGSGAFVKKTLAQVKSILGLGTAAYTAATAYVTHALVTAANDFLIASGNGAVIKKTLAETKVILGLTIQGVQEELTSGGAISTAKYCSYISAESDGTDYTLGSGTETGQLKKIVCRNSESVGCMVAGVFEGVNVQLTFATDGEFALLQWTGTAWRALELGSIADLVNAPELSES